MGTDEETAGISREEAVGGPKNDDGFTRFEDHLALLSDSDASRRGLKREEVERVGDGIRAGAEEGGTAAAGRGGGRTGEDEWYSCPGTVVLGAFPIVIAFCKRKAQI